MCYGRRADRCHRLPVLASLRQQCHPWRIWFGSDSVRSSVTSQDIEDCGIDDAYLENVLSCQPNPCRPQTCLELTHGRPNVVLRVSGALSKTALCL